MLGHCDEKVTQTPTSQRPHLPLLSHWLLSSNLWSLEWQMDVNNHKNLGFEPWILTKTMVETQELQGKDVTR